jgi:hypothetical protein
MEMQMNLKKFLQNLTNKQDESEPLNPEVEGMYELVTLPEKPEAWCVKLTQGKFKDVVYTYGKVDVSNLLTPKIEYEILWSPPVWQNQEVTEEVMKEFNTLIGKIVMNIIYADAGKFVEKDDKLILKK